MIKDLQAIKEIEVLPLEESMKILRGEAEEQEQAGPEPVDHHLERSVGRC